MVSPGTYYYLRRPLFTRLGKKKGFVDRLWRRGKVRKNNGKSYLYNAISVRQNNIIMMY